MAILDNPDAFSAAVTKALRDQVDAIVDEEATKAEAAVRRRMHDAVGNIALSVLQRYEITMQRNDLVIRVMNEVIK